MAFLRVNGMEVPVKQGGEIRVIESRPTRGFSLNGTPTFGRSRTHRAYRFTTTHMTREESMALLSLLMHEGDAWQFAPPSFSGIDTTTATAYSDKGLADSSASFAVVDARGADGSRVYTSPPGVFSSPDGIINTFSDCQPATPGMWSRGAVTVGSDTTNLLSAANAECSSAAAFTAFLPITTTLSVSTSHYWQGTNSLKIASTGGGGGAHLNNATGGALTGGSTYNIQCRMKAVPSTTTGGDFEIRMAVDDRGTSSTEFDNDLTLDTSTNEHADRWFQFDLVVTIDAGATDVNLFFYGEYLDAWDLYVDGLMITEADEVRSWVAGGSSRNSQRLLYTVDWLRDVDAITLATWVNPYAVDPSNNTRVIAVGDTSAGVSTTLFCRTTGAWSSIIQDSRTGTSITVAQANGSASVTTADGWTHLAATYNLDTYTTSLYINGTLAATSTAGANAQARNRRLTYAENSTNQISIGSTLSLTQKGIGAIANPMIIPAILSADQIADLAAMADGDFGIGIAPLYVDGDALPVFRNGMKCIANVSQATIQEIYFSGVLEKAQEITFELVEYVDP